MDGTPSRTVLVVEDYDIAREGLGRLLRRSGCLVFEAASGFDAIAYIHSGVRPPDIIVVDLMLGSPDGVSVIRVIRDMKLISTATGLPSRVVAYTGSDKSADLVTNAVAAGADAVILKPCDLPQTLAVIFGDEPGDVTIPTRPGPAIGFPNK